MVNRQNIWIICLIFSIMFLIHCSGSESQQPQPQQESGGIDGLLQDAFEAIKTQNREKYNDLTITSADFVLKRMGISKLKENQSYVGTSVKPAEIKKQHAQFQQAVKVDEKFEEDMIYFDKDTFISAGRIIDQGVMKALNNVQIPYKIYTIKVKSDGGAVMDDLYPYFMIVHWNNRPRILKLIFPE